MKKIKQKIIFYKALLVEILETLCSICLYLGYEGRTNRFHNPRAEYMQSHFEQLKQATAVLRKELSKGNGG